MQDHAEATRERELDAALARLRATDGPVTRAERAVLDRLSQRLVDRLLVAPTRVRRAVGPADGRETMRGPREFPRPEEPQDESAVVRESGNADSSPTTRNDSQ